MTPLENFEINKKLVTSNAPHTPNGVCGAICPLNGNGIPSHTPIPQKSESEIESSRNQIHVRPVYLEALSF